MRLKALVVEADPRSSDLMVEALKSFHMEPRFTSDSEEALALINREKYDGIFLELMMPKLDGFELSRQIRQSLWNPSTPIIIITAREEKQTVTRAFEAGATFFLQKPLDKEKLLNLVKSIRGAMLEERRRTMRVPIYTDVTWTSGDHTASGRSYNLCRGGMLFQGDDFLRKGSTVQLSFYLPGKKHAIGAEGIVVHTDDQQRAGIGFVKVGQEDQAQIRDFIAGHVTVH